MDPGLQLGPFHNPMPPLQLISSIHSNNLDTLYHCLSSNYLNNLDSLILTIFCYDFVLNSWGSILLFMYLCKNILGGEQVQMAGMTRRACAQRCSCTVKKEISFLIYRVCLFCVIIFVNFFCGCKDLSLES